MNLPTDPEFTNFVARLNSDVSSRLDKARQHWSDTIQGKEANRTDMRRLILLSVSLGLDSQEATAADFIDWLQNEESLPSLKDLGYAMFYSGASPQIIKGILEDKVATANKKIDALATSTSSTGWG